MGTKHKFLPQLYPCLIFHFNLPSLLTSLQHRTRAQHACSAAACEQAAVIVCPLCAKAIHVKAQQVSQVSPAVCAKATYVKAQQFCLLLSGNWPHVQHALVYKRARTYTHTCTHTHALTHTNTQIHSQDANAAFQAHSSSPDCDPANYNRVHNKQRW